MTRLHVVMKQRHSPIASFPSVPHEIYERKKEACDRAAELNRKSTFNDYWVESASLKQAGSSYWQP
jgi:hypothetical protein